MVIIHQAMQTAYQRAAAKKRPRNGKHRECRILPGRAKPTMPVSWRSAAGTIFPGCHWVHCGAGGRPVVRKLIAFDDDTFDKLKQLGRDRMATIQELADEAFADLLKKHGIPVDLKDALRKSASLAKSDKSSPPRKRKS
jgi:hypothetical protein